MASVSLYDLCNLTSFVTNNPHAVLSLANNLSPAKALLASDLIASEAQIERVELFSTLYTFLDFPEMSGLCSSIKNSHWIRSFSITHQVGTFKFGPAFSRTIAAALGPRLERVEISGTEFGTEQSAQVFRALSRQCAGSLRELVVEGCNFADKSVVDLLTCICKLPLLESVELSNNVICNYDHASLAGALNAIPRLEHLVLRNINISELVPSSGINVMAAISLGALKTAKKLRTLELEASGPANQKFASLLDDFLHSTAGREFALETLLLKSNCFELAKKGNKLIELIKRAPRLRRLNIFSNPVKEPAAAALGGAIGSAREMEKLCISDCMTSSRAIEDFFGAMRAGGKALKSLRMSYNGTEDAGTVAIAGFLSVSASRIAVLEMRRNRITEPGALALAKSLERLTSLTTLSLSYNSLGPTGAAAILDALCLSHTKMSPMLLVSMRHCLAQDQGAAAAGRLIRGSGCRSLELDGNKICEEGAKAIATAIFSCAEGTVIKSLFLGENQLGKLGAEWLAERVIKPNRVVVELDIMEIYMGDAGAKAIAAAIMGREEGVMKSVIIYGNDFTELGVNEFKAAMEREQTANHKVRLSLGRNCSD